MIGDTYNRPDMLFDFALGSCHHHHIILNPWYGIAGYLSLFNVIKEVGGLATISSSNISAKIEL
jgi:hypothetical protein